MNDPNDEFADIRPYNDSEVRPALDRLIDDDEFISAIINLRIKKQSRLMKALAYPFVRQRMRRALKHIHDVEGVQDLVKVFLDRMLKNSSTSFTVSGLEHLDKNDNYLFICNHRDIVLDPALVNYALKICGHSTVRIAIGDNLHSKSFISDLMRLNKSFIVKRSIKGPRERVIALRLLSKYINKSILEDKSNLWIAQGEGRAKDGRDITQPAIIKMIAMNKPKDESFADYINRLKIVPVSISYEYDPCDADKANELYIRATTGSYQKKHEEDFGSIAKGIKGNKGNIHLSFGTVLNGNFKNAAEVAQEIDKEIISNYKVNPINEIAYKIKHSQSNWEEIKSNKQIMFHSRLDGIPKAHHPFILDMYANVISLQKELIEKE